jgi:hypothetical protein
MEHYFLRRMADSVLQFSNDIMCWDEAVSAGLPVSRTYVSWWRQNHPESLNEAISKGFKVVLCPRLPLYFDFVQDSTHRSGRNRIKNTSIPILIFIISRKIQSQRIYLRRRTYLACREIYGRKLLSQRTDCNI